MKAKANDTPDVARAPNVKKAWIKFFGGALALATLGAFTSGCDEHHFRSDCGEPLAPVGVYSVTGDGRVTVYWIPVDEDAIDDFVVYRARSLNGTYYELGHTGRDYFVDRDARNGETYFYAVAALNYCGDESGLSREVAQDTPRPEGFAARLFDANGNDWVRSGWDFSAYRTVPWDHLNTDVYLVFSDGVPYLVAADVDTDIQDAGYARFDDITWAPDGGWSPTGTAEAIEGHTYVIWTRDNHFAKARVVSVTGSRIEFDWAYQIDRGNPELKPRLRPGEDPLAPKAVPRTISRP
jgi:hypothetical protein